MAKCIRCGGMGVIEIDGKDTECQCSILSRLAQSMPAYIRSTPVMKAHIEHPVTNSINKNLFIKSTWTDIAAIIKVTLYKHNNLYVRITTDREITDVGVGAKSRKARGDDAIIVYDCLQDFIEPPRLLVVHLNRLKYKNKAASGMLEEAVNLRCDYQLPLWVIFDVDNPYGEGSYSFSHTLWSLLHSTTFTGVVIPRISYPPDMTSKTESTQSTPNNFMDDPITQVYHDDKPQDEDKDEVGFESRVSLYNKGIPKDRNSFKRGKK